MLAFLLLIIGGVALYAFKTRIDSMQRDLDELGYRLVQVEQQSRREEVSQTPTRVAPPRYAPPPLPTAPVAAAKPEPIAQTPAPVAMTAPAPIAQRVAAHTPIPADNRLAPEPESEAPQRGFGFEDLFGRRLPIWAGGITLAIAGVLLVRYSIEAGLLSPLVRVVLGLLFGTGLIASAEVALRQEERVRDPRVQQALSGAGIATLYAVILAACNLYGLIGGGTAFIGLAAVTGLAMGLSLRFGTPSALLGLFGGMAAPALVSTGQPNIPLLACYLALATGGLCALSRAQRWMWLGVGALIGGAGWGAALIVSGALDAAASISVALLVIALGLGLPLVFAAGPRGSVLRTVSAVVAAAQIAALVATGGFEILHWGLFGLLSIGLFLLGLRDAALRPIMAVGLAVALILAIIWPAMTDAPIAITAFLAVMTGIVAIYGAPALCRLWRNGGSMLEAGQFAGLALGGFAATFAHFWHLGHANDIPLALSALGCAAAALAAMALGWRCTTRRDDARFVTLASTAGLLFVIAASLGLIGWILAIAIAATAAALLVLSPAADDVRIEYVSWTFALGGILTLISGSHASAELPQLAGVGADSDIGSPSSILRWAAAAAMATLFAWRGRIDGERSAAQVAAALLGYGALAQAIPAFWLPVAVALAIPLLAEAARRLPEQRLLPAQGVAVALAVGWAFLPLALWVAPALLSFAGTPMLAPDRTLIYRLAVPALAIGLALWRNRGTSGAMVREAGLAIASTLALIAAHMAFKQGFALHSTADAVRLGLAERTLWEALLLAAGFGLWRTAGERGGAARIAALGFTGAALAHNLWYSQLLHGPIWASTMVGPSPIANLLLPAFALPVAALWLATRIAPEFGARTAAGAEILRMLLILLFVHASWRQAFAGSALTQVPVGPVEDIGRSVIAIVLAIGFLLWGIRTQNRDWRIASLLLMLGAVAKVFLFDASGLEGLLRIASFMALGFSLIGIGWLYSRQLRN